jgi:hypothetical protein
VRRDARIPEERMPTGTRIYLNDKLIHECVVFDTDAGFIERWKTNDAGRIIAPPILICEYGVVRVEEPPNAS